MPTLVKDRLPAMNSTATVSSATGSGRRTHRKSSSGTCKSLPDGLIRAGAWPSSSFDCSEPGALSVNSGARSVTDAMSSA